MSIKKFFKQQFQLRNFRVQYDVSSKFYLSCFQKDLSTTPLLIVRAVICIGCLSIWIASMALTSQHLPIKFWAIYLTHWGLIMNTIAAGSGLLVSIIAAIKLPDLSTDSNSGLPWHVQGYWIMFNIATPIAFFITVFYYILLAGLEQDFAINHTLDIFIHAVNSILMFALLMCSRHPNYFYHFYIPNGFAVIYLIFSYIYFVSGGTNPFGDHAIYPMLDWEKPGQTLGMALFCTVGITLIHGIFVALTAGRDYLTRRFREKSTAYEVYNAYY